MPDAVSNANPDIGSRGELLRSLGKLARGLSALFWGLPVALVVSVQTARTDWLRPLGLVPVLAVMGLLLFGLWQMGAFQKQERPWRDALDRAKLLGLVNFGLCPFLYWWNKLPGDPFFLVMVCVFALSGLLFVFDLNLVLERLGAMLPDETLRHETKQFTLLNRALLVVLLVLATIYHCLTQITNPPLQMSCVIAWFEETRLWLWGVTVFALLPLAMTMALIWKTKEVILEGVFGAKP